MMKSEIKSNQRNYLIDNIRGVAIFLVVWGHSIQFLGGNEFDFFENKVFAVLYSFHMPLFMFVSGYLFTNTPKKRRTYEILKSKFHELVIPIIIWSAIFTIAFYGRRVLTGINVENILYLVKMYIKFLPIYLWFFWTVYACMLLTTILAKSFGDIRWTFLLATLLLFAIPDFSLLIYVKYLFPYFIAGYFYKHYSKQIAKYRSVLVLISGIIFIYGVTIWNTDYYIYNTGMSLNAGDHISEKFQIIAVRYIMGFVGTFLFITILRSFQEFRTNFWLSKIGINTYGIYILQTPLVHLFRKIIKLDTDKFFLYNFLYTPTLSIIAIILSLIIIRFITANKFSHKYLLGARN